MPSSNDDLIGDVARYYSSKIAEHGETARGVDWNTEQGQVDRFEQLCKVIPDSGDTFSINDLGCGYGALVDHLAEHYSAFDYHGFDVSADMVAAASAKWQERDNVSFSVAAVPTQPADFGMASGIFNVRLTRSKDEWHRYLLDTLDALDATSRRGFAFNCLTAYSDADRMCDDLYYANPGELFDVCKTRYARNVALLHDYGLYEFSILVRKAL
ncbi:MAG: class I SAM-dependent methyltransferase [Pseudomonadota bacterium]